MSINPIVGENARQGTSSWLLDNPATQHEIEGYASLTSVDRNDGRGIDFFVSTAASELFSYQIFRMGWYGGAGARLARGPVMLPGSSQPIPPRDPHFGTFDCDWQISFNLNSSDFSGWVSGVYLVKLTGVTSGWQSYCIFVLRDDTSEADYVFQSSVTTYQAYNEWPGPPDGMSIYAPGGAEVTGAAALKVSFNRPYGITRLGSAFTLGQPYNVNSIRGAGAGEFLTNLSSDRYTMASGWEYNMVRFLEREGYDVSYLTSIDTHRVGADRLLQHRAFLSVGHDEYWTWEMRDAVEGARDRGLNLAFFSSNTSYWQARLESSSNGRGQDNRILVVYKDDLAPQRVDFITGKGDDFIPADHRTILWANVPRPDAAMTGVSVFQAPSAGPDKFFSADLVVYDPASYAFAGTGLAAGDTIRGIVGMESDAMQPTSPLGANLIAQSPITSGPPSDMVSYTAPSGSTVISVDSMQWSWGLDDFDVSGTRPAFASETVRQVTRNILQRMLSTGNQLDSLTTYGVLPAELDPARWTEGAICEGPPSDALAVGPPGPDGLSLQPASGTAGFGGIVSSSAWDLRGKQVRVQAGDTGGAQMDTFLALTSDHDNWRRVIREDSQLYFQANDNGDRTWLVIDYSADDHLWWQISHDEVADSLIYETSPDGIWWQYQYEYPAPDWLGAAFVELQAGTLGAVDDPGAARFRAFAVEPGSPRQDGTGFSDDFGTFARDEQRWLVTLLSTGPGEGSATVTQGGGALSIRPPARSKRPLTEAPSTFVDDPDYSGYVSREAASFVHMTASVEVARTCGGPGGVTIFGVGADADNWIRFRKSGTLLHFELANDGEVSAEQIDYDTSAHRWWRISHLPGNLTFDTSSDGAAWATQVTVPQPTWIGGTHVEFQAGSESSDDTNSLGQAVFNSFSLSPLSPTVMF